MPSHAKVYIELFSTEAGGRASPVNLSEHSPEKYRPHLRVKGDSDEMLGVEFLDGLDGLLKPGGSTYATIRLLYGPNVDYSELKVDAEFDILEGSKVIGKGRVILI